jgi:hypothetical protein
MKIKLAGKHRAVFILLSALMIGFSSCRTARDLPAERLRPLSAEKILKQAEQNAFDYTDLTIRRINVQFSNSSTKTSFRANLKAKKGEQILASISKLNLPVGRVLLTPESITYVNYIDRNYFLDDYTFLSGFLNFNLNFDIIQSVISNSSISNGSDSGWNNINQKLDSSVEGGRYVVQSGNNHSVWQSAGLSNPFSNRNRRNAGGRQEPVTQKMYFNPRSFNLERLEIETRESNWKLEVDYSNFEKVNKKNYPGSIDLKMSSSNEVVELKIRLNGFSTEKIDVIDLNIPDRYEQIRRN